MRKIGKGFIILKLVVLNYIRKDFNEIGLSLVLVIYQIFRGVLRIFRSFVVIYFIGYIRELLFLDMYDGWEYLKEQDIIQQFLQVLIVILVVGI